MIRKAGLDNMAKEQKEDSKTYGYLNKYN